MAILTKAQAYAYAQSAGFGGTSADIIVAIAYAESGLNTLATNTVGNSAGTDRGILQINSVYHAEVSDRWAFDPGGAFLAGYRISSNGTNFTPWSTFGNGAYKRYLSSANVPSTPATSQVAQATSNTYPQGQCTWWASQRYKQLAGYYVPWKDNANGWATQAASFGWQVAALPPKGIPSILVLQGGVQGAGGTYGHVAVVEKVNADGSVYASSQNWGLNPIARAQTSYWTFTPGAGVSFVWASGTGSGGGPFGILTGGDPLNIAGIGSVLGQVHTTLIDNAGFLAIALAVDEAEQFTGYVNLTTSPYDISGIIRSVGVTVGDNMPPVLIRGGLIGLGTILLVALIVKMAMGPVATLAPLAKALL